MRFWERFLKPKKVRSVVYTCLTGGYDSLKEHRYIDNDWDYVCFTDNKELLAQKKCGIWEIRPLAYVGADNTRSSRYHKINPHKLFPDYEQSIWCDGNVCICSPYLFRQIRRRKKSLLVPVHFVRNCIYEEFAEVEKLGYEATDVLRKQRELIEHSGFPEHFGLAETNVLYRRHNEPEIIKLMEDWWYFVADYSKRDQLIFSYVLWKKGYKIKDFFIKHPARRGQYQHPGADDVPGQSAEQLLRANFDYVQPFGV